MTELDRRSFLRLAGAAGLAVATGCHAGESQRPVRSTGSSVSTVPPTTDQAPRLWSDPGTWGGTVPGPSDAVTVSQSVVLDVDASVKSVTIEPGGALSFDPGSSVALSSQGNVVVLGHLTVRPDHASNVHLIEFVGVDEEQFVGGGMSVLDSDVGLWVPPGGILDIWGTNRLPWTRAAGDIRAGDRHLDLLQVPDGWQPGDELVILPTSAPGTDAHQAFDECAVKEINGKTIVLNTPVHHDHPAADVGRGRVLTAEVLNLTRNVVIAGTPEGRAHTVILGNAAGGAGAMVKPQRAGYFRLEHMGPYNARSQGVPFSEVVDESRPIDARTGEPMRIPVLARWPFHFHHAGEGSRGSLIEGAVAYRPSSHAFVAHQSHGVTFDGCVAYDSITSPFWWDGDGKAPHPSRSRVHPPDHTVDGEYRDCVAAGVRNFEDIEHLEFEAVWADGWGPEKVNRADQLRWPDFGPARLGGFTLVKERGMINGGVAVGVQGTFSGGVVWPEAVAGERWEVEDVVVHNNGEHGTFGWHNALSRHSVRRLVSYHNGKAGIFHGAYANPYLFTDCICHGNGVGVEWHANAEHKAEVPQEWTRLVCDGDWEAHKHSAGGQRATVFRECHFNGRIRFLDREGLQPGIVTFVDCTYQGRPLEEGDLDLTDAHPDNEITITAESPNVGLPPLPPLPLPRLAGRGPSAA